MELLERIRQVCALIKERILSMAQRTSTPTMKNTWSASLLRLKSQLMTSASGPRCIWTTKSKSLRTLSNKPKVCRQRASSSTLTNPKKIWIISQNRRPNQVCSKHIEHHYLSRRETPNHLCWCQLEVARLVELLKEEKELEIRTSWKKGVHGRRSRRSRLRSKAGMMLTLTFILITHKRQVIRAKRASHIKRQWRLPKSPIPRTANQRPREPTESGLSTTSNREGMTPIRLKSSTNTPQVRSSFLASSKSLPLRLSLSSRL